VHFCSRPLVLFERWVIQKSKFFSNLRKKMNQEFVMM